MIQIMNFLAIGYAAFTGLWLLLRRITGDRPSWLQLVNDFTRLLLAPSAPILLLSLLRRSPLGVAAALAPAAVLARLKPPPFGSGVDAASDRPRLRVMTLNMLCRQRSARKTVEVIRESAADVVMLQEVLPGIARALVDQLRDQYPFQVLHPADRARGMAVFSRIPIESEQKFQLSLDGWY